MKTTLTNNEVLDCFGIFEGYYYFFPKSNAFYKEVFDRYDSDKDGSLDKKEFEEFVYSLAIGRFEFLKSYDIKCNHVVSKNLRRGATGSFSIPDRKSTDEVAKKIYQEYDKNGDKKINFDEFFTLYKKVKTMNEKHYFEVTRDMKACLALVKKLFQFIKEYVANVKVEDIKKDKETKGEIAFEEATLSKENFYADYKFLVYMYVLAYYEDDKVDDTFFAKFKDIDNGFEDLKKFVPTIEEFIHCWEEFTK